MKKLCAFILAICLFSAGYAQINSLPTERTKKKMIASPYFQRGSWLTGGHTSLKFGSQDQDGEKFHETSFRFRPDIGYFLCSAFVLGLALEYQCNSYHLNDDPRNKSNTIGAGIFSRYYFLFAF